LKIDHAPVSALAAGDIVHLGNGLIGIANRAIAAAEQDALDISPNSVYRVKKAVGTGVVFAQGDEVFWDTVAETAVVDSNANTVRFGQAVQASVTGDDHVKACPNRHELGEEGAAIAAGAAHVADPASAAALTQETVTDNSGGAVSTTIAAATNTDTLTDSSGGAANTTIAAITGLANAGSADTGPVADGFADIAAQLAKQKSLNTVLINAVASIAAQLAKIKTDVAAVRTGSEANNTAIDAVLVALETSKILKSA
jgi:hypothetical protein